MAVRQRRTGRVNLTRMGARSKADLDADGSELGCLDMKRMLLAPYHKAENQTARGILFPIVTELLGTAFIGFLTTLALHAVSLTPALNVLLKGALVGMVYAFTWMVVSRLGRRNNIKPEMIPHVSLAYLFVGVNGVVGLLVHLATQFGGYCIAGAILQLVDIGSVPNLATAVVLPNIHAYNFLTVLSAALVAGSVVGTHMAGTEKKDEDKARKHAFKFGAYMIFIVTTVFFMFQIYTQGPLYLSGLLGLTTPTANSDLPDAPNAEVVNWAYELFFNWIGGAVAGIMALIYILLHGRIWGDSQEEEEYSPLPAVPAREDEEDMKENGVVLDNAKSRMTSLHVAAFGTKHE